MYPLLIKGLILTILGLGALPAHAYLDPGSGSLIFQAIVGGIAAIIVTMKLYWHKIKLKLSRRKSSGPESSQEDESPTDD